MWRLGLLAVVTGSAPAAEYWVAPAGRDEHPGTAQAPFQTIGRSLRQATAGDTIWIRAGRYAEAATLAGCGRADAPLVIRGAGDGPVVIGQSDVLGPEWFAESGTYAIDCQRPVRFLFVDPGTYPLVQMSMRWASTSGEVARTPGSFTYDSKTLKLYMHPEDRLTDPNAHRVAVAYNDVGLIVSGARHVVVQDLVLSQAGRVGILVASGSEEIRLQHCQVHTAETGFCIDASSRITLMDCTARDCAKGLAVHDTRRLTLDHVLVYRTRAHGLIASGANPGLAITNCIFKAGGISGSIYYLAGPAPPGFRSDGNCLVQYMNPADSFRVFVNGQEYRELDAYRRATGQDGRSISVAPGFVDETPGREDLRLKPDSPCRGRGLDGADLGPRTRQP